MQRSEACQLLRRINQLHFELEATRRMEEEIKDKLLILRQAHYPAGLIHADFIESEGRYVFLDDLKDGHS